MRKKSSSPMIAAEETEIFRKALPGRRGMVVSQRGPREPRSGGFLVRHLICLGWRRQSRARTCVWNLGIFPVTNGGKCSLSSSAAVPCSH